LYKRTPEMASEIPTIFAMETALRKNKIDRLIIKILFVALATEYVRGVTRLRTEKARMFWRKLRSPSRNRRRRTEEVKMDWVWWAWSGSKGGVVNRDLKSNITQKGTNKRRES